MSKAPNPTSDAQPVKASNWQIPALFAFGVIFIVVLLWLVFSRSSLNHDQCQAVKIVMALAAAGIGAIVPGTLSANVPGLARAGGAAAFFLIALVAYSCPNDPTTRPEKTEAPADARATSQVASGPTYPPVATTIPITVKPPLPSTTVTADGAKDGSNAAVNVPDSTSLPPKFDPIYAAWLGTWQDDSIRGISSELDILKDEKTEKLVGQLQAVSENSDGGMCQVFYDLDLSEPYYTEGLTFKGQLSDVQGSCSNSNDKQITGSIMLLKTKNGDKDTSQITIAYNMNIDPKVVFTKEEGPCKLASGGLLGKCIPDPSAAYHH